jgi:H+-transporting ATPase
VVVVLALVYFILNSIPILRDLGRRERSKKNTQWEDFTEALQKLTIIHEKGDQDTYAFVDKVALLVSPACAGEKTTTHHFA